MIALLKINGSNPVLLKIRKLEGRLVNTPIHKRQPNMGKSKSKQDVFGNGGSTSHIPNVYKPQSFKILEVNIQGIECSGRLEQIRLLY